MLQIKPATKFKQFARVVFWGVEKSGKTHAALSLATRLAGETGKIGVISSEYASSQFLQHRFPHDIIDLTEVDSQGNIARNAFSAARYEEAIKLFVKDGYSVIVIDSLSHLWEGEGGILDAVNSRRGNTFNDGWGENSPIYRRTIQAILSTRAHIIITLRAKDGYIQQDYLKKDGTKGTQPVNVGLAPVMRKNFGYEMHLKIRMESMIGTVEATAMQDYIPRGEEVEAIDDDFATRLLAALDGEPMPEPTEQQKDMRSLLDEFYGLAPLTYAHIANWEQQALRAALGISRGQSLPTDYTDDDVEKMRAYLANKRQRKAAPIAVVEVQPTPPPETEASYQSVSADPDQVLLASPQQRSSIAKLCERLEKTVELAQDATFEQAREIIKQLTTEYKELRANKQPEAMPASPIAIIRTRVGEVRPTFTNDQKQVEIATFQTFYRSATGHAYVDDASVTAEDIEKMNTRLDAIIRTRANKKATANQGA